jgi:hypothetical protein
MFQGIYIGENNATARNQLQQPTIYEEVLVLGGVYYLKDAGSIGHRLLA